MEIWDILDSEGNKTGRRRAYEAGAGGPGVYHP